MNSSYTLSEVCPYRKYLTCSFALSSPVLDLSQVRCSSAAAHTGGVELAGSHFSSLTLIGVINFHVVTDFFKIIRYTFSTEAQAYLRSQVFLSQTALILILL